MNIYGKCPQVYTAFRFVGHAFWKENIEDGVKLLEGFKLPKDDNRQFGENGAMSLTPLLLHPPPPPRQNVPPEHIFCLTGQ